MGLVCPNQGTGSHFLQCMRTMMSIYLFYVALSLNNDVSLFVLCCFEFSIGITLVVRDLFTLSTNDHDHHI